MPTLRIMSIYKKQKRLFAAELAAARAEREQFMATIMASFGEIATMASMLSKGGSAAAKKLEALDHKVIVVRRKVRTADCWYRESPGPGSVLEMTGLSWRMVNERCLADGRLPISGVSWLLNALRAADQVMPGEEPSRGWSEMEPGPWHLPKKWRRRLRRRRRRLMLLLDMALMLEEDIQWRFRM
jgi:hypothetical protein